ncbi:MAG TPA: lipid-binding SYLF domain-containing protein [Bryobacteraceae bacterium]|jgi:lipid-binding SYLF domain-containing protein|nr:lipid-binding SYLF domain-containing protein [Bryobacteraceae bacterium]
MKWIPFTLAAALACAPVLANDLAKTSERLNDAASLFSEVMATPDRAIPQGLLDKAYCMVLVPGLKKAAVLVGAKYGRGYAVCRAPHEGWGPPAAIRIEGGSIGAQIGISSTDVVLLIMNSGGMKRLTKSKFTIGAEATAAAGPVGRNATAQTDGLMTAEILSWSRSRGLFGGISLDGATLRNDIDENQVLYGQRWNSKQILMSGAKPIPAAAKLLEVLSKYSPRRVGQNAAAMGRFLEILRRG